MFKDSPEQKHLETAIAGWGFPDLPGGLKAELVQTQCRSFGVLSAWYKERLNSPQSPSSLEKNERLLINWLFDFIRLNIKRGRIFDLGEVIQAGEADCLGYAKLFNTLGRQCGLDLGVVEVVTDNRGYNVPHSATLVKLAGGRRQFVDLWYGSKNIRHKRLGLNIKREDVWKIEDIDFLDIKKAEDISYLPDGRVDAITFYIEGNRSLKEGNFKQAIERYNQAIELYPQNYRVYYNRAIACEKLGESQMAEQDYAQALSNETALRRTLAAQPQGVVDLIKLDDNFVPELDQEIYLLSEGFITGRPVSLERIARKLAISREEVSAILNFIDNFLNE